MKYAILTLACLVAFASPAVAGSISGVVKGADGSIVTAGLVTASRQPGGMTPRLGKTSAGAPILPDGAFHLPPLVDGLYQICAQAPDTVWLNSCEWGHNGTTASLSSSQASVQVPIVLTKGALVTVRVNDAAQLLTTHEGKSPGAHLLLGVSTDSHFFRAAGIISQDVAGRTYQMLVPFDRSINLSVASAFFQMSDATGKALLKSGNLIPVLVPSGQQPPTVLLNVSGRTSP